MEAARGTRVEHFSDVCVLIDLICIVLQQLIINITNSINEINYIEPTW